uniref:Transmembrane protein putative n=1 Tax=Albugo laibachii Nc14 TaxID=890382 RepID=F0WHS1_9STRA|nr:transmembrane protein putative [Albugo laibachii Nc14]|eukprot:CCA20796.1 transmembrane protein putative [Albugo laibachii Nc14]
MNNTRDDKHFASLDTPEIQNAPSTPSNGTPFPSLRRRQVQIEINQAECAGPVWMYPGEGSYQHLTPSTEEMDTIHTQLQRPKQLLSEWPSTAICGNDILSSVLYSSGLVALKAGKLAPVPLILVAILLYFFRFIYEEAITAFPLNGGSYNVLLNTTSKRMASFGAALGILSYLATGVVSATSAVNYVETQIELPVTGTTIGLLGVFALLSVYGIGESAVIATVIFAFHVLTLILLSIASLVYSTQHGSIFIDNMKTSLPPIDFAGKMITSNVFAAIFFGFSAALLGITGFESSANFVEEQQGGVFRKTLRNMWALVTVFNIVLSFLSLAVLPLEGANGIYKHSEVVLANMGRVAAGPWLETWVSIDAFIVLSGAVLTSYVGITGLVRRLAFDRVLPAFLMKQNPWRHTNHTIILLYFLVATSLVLILNADVGTLSGVYTYAFLGLMTLFACGCMALKAKRADVPRDVDAPWWTCIVGCILVILGIFGNLLGDPKVLMYFAIYLIVVVSAMFLMLERVLILRVILAIMKRIFPSKSVKDPTQALMSEPSIHTGARGGRTIIRAIIDVQIQPIIFFCKRPDMTRLNKAILYVRRNEQTQNLRFVYVDERNLEEQQSVLSVFQDMVALLDFMYPKLKIDFVFVEGIFDPAMVLWISEKMLVATNLMFIAQPGNALAHKISRLGVRVITG